MSVFTAKRDVLNLATLAVGDRVDVRTARERAGTAEVSFGTVVRALQACRAAQGNNLDESGLDRGRGHDALEAERQRLREPGLGTAVQEARIELLDARRALLPIEAQAREELKAARVPALRALVAKLFEALDAAAEVSARVQAHEEETAGLLGGVPGFFDTVAWATEFSSDAHRESVLEFRRRKAIEAGLL